MSTSQILAIVVTYNRKEKLEECVRALLEQRAACDILVVDNGSKDGTREALACRENLSNRNLHYILLDENMGGAGGFCQGLKFGLNGNWQWFWLMDDDAIAEPDALKNMISNAVHHDMLYGSAAVGNETELSRLCWPTIVIRNGCKQYVEYFEMLHALEEVEMIPFLGFFLHRDLVQRIGYPDRDFFICADDKEYCERAKRRGARVFLVKSSIIRHPPSKSSIHVWFGVQAAYRSLPPWKVYYDVRNKLLIARKYYGYRVWTQTLPGIIVRALIGMAAENQRALVLRMYLKAIADGFAERKGKRVQPLAP